MTKCDCKVSFDTRETPLESSSTSWILTKKSRWYPSDKMCLTVRPYLSLHLLPSWMPVSCCIKPSPAIDVYALGFIEGSVSHCSYVSSQPAHKITMATCPLHCKVRWYRAGGNLKIKTVKVSMHRLLSTLRHTYKSAVPDRSLLVFPECNERHSLGKYTRELTICAA